MSLPTVISLMHIVCGAVVWHKMVIKINGVPGFFFASEDETGGIEDRAERIGCGAAALLCVCRFQNSATSISNAHG